MTAITVKVCCPIHGDLDLTPPDIRLILWGTDRGLYVFRCATCAEDVLKPADDEVIALLRSASVRVVQMPEQPVSDAPPISLDDAIDLGLEMREL